MRTIHLDIAGVAIDNKNKSFYSLPSIIKNHPDSAAIDNLAEVIAHEEAHLQGLNHTLMKTFLYRMILGGERWARGSFPAYTALHSLAAEPGTIGLTPARRAAAERQGLSAKDSLALTFLDRGNFAFSKGRYSRAQAWYLLANRCAEHPLTAVEAYASILGNASRGGLLWPEHVPIVTTYTCTEDRDLPQHRTLPLSSEPIPR